MPSDPNPVPESRSTGADAVLHTQGTAEDLAVRCIKAEEKLAAVEKERAAHVAEVERLRGLLGEVRERFNVTVPPNIGRVEAGFSWNAYKAGDWCVRVDAALGREEG